MAPNIIQTTSIVNTNYAKNRNIKYLVIHYTAGVTSKKGTARNVCNWFKSPNNTRKASADFVVDDVEIVQYNPDIENRYCNAVGGKKYPGTSGAKFYGIANNSNCISIEICSSNRYGRMTVPNDENYYFTDEAIKNAIKLAKHLIKKYNLELIRHFDVNGKPCPGIWGWSVGNEEKWLDFKNEVLEKEKNIVKVSYNGTKHELQGMLVDGRNYVGIREITEKVFGKAVEWNPQTREVIIINTNDD